MELWLGPSHHGSVFASHEDLQRAWLMHRDRLMVAWGKRGKRPQAWWEFESPVPYPRDSDYAEATLYEANLLTAEERTELEARWREEFQRAQTLNWACLGPNRFLSGEEAKRAHLKWAGVPHSLLKQWNAERRRRGKVVRKLAATASAPEPVERLASRE
jgi:hypothetical protein